MIDLYPELRRLLFGVLMLMLAACAPPPVDLSPLPIPTVMERPANFSVTGESGVEIIVTDASWTTTRVPAFSASDPAPSAFILLLYNQLDDSVVSFYNIPYDLPPESAWTFAPQNDGISLYASFVKRMSDNFGEDVQGQLTITREGDLLSGTFEFTANRSGLPTATITVNGAFAEVRLPQLPVEDAPAELEE